MKLKRYESIIPKLKKYKRVFKEQDEVNTEEKAFGTPIPQWELKIRAKISDANDKLNTAQEKRDYDTSDYWFEYKKYLENYLANPNFGAVLKLSREHPNVDTNNRGDVDAANEILGLYDENKEANWKQTDEV